MTAGLEPLDRSLERAAREAAFSLLGATLD
jgi:hypothetical protein